MTPKTKARLALRREIAAYRDARQLRDMYRDDWYCRWRDDAYEPLHKWTRAAKDCADTIATLFSQRNGAPQ